MDGQAMGGSVHEVRLQRPNVQTNRAAAAAAAAGRQARAGEEVPRPTVPGLVVCVLTRRLGEQLASLSALGQLVRVVPKKSCLLSCSPKELPGQWFLASHRSSSSIVLMGSDWPGRRGSRCTGVYPEGSPVFLATTHEF